MSRTDGAGSGKAASWEMSGGVPPSTRRLGRRIDDIEVLRGLAVTWVVVWHVRGELIDNMPPMLAMFYRYFGGGSGVDLFFVISGFVIARSLMPTLDGGSPSRLFLR